MTRSDLVSWVREIYNQFGQQKTMGKRVDDTTEPYYFLHRTFLGENDLLIIFNTKKCRNRCSFCALSELGQCEMVGEEDILCQFRHIISELRHSLSVFGRVTLSNNGSMLDEETFPAGALLAIAEAISNLRRVRTLVLETRLSVINTLSMKALKSVLPKIGLDILTGLETCSPAIREKVLGKKETLAGFEDGLDKVAATGASLSSYILYKPDYKMTDEEAFYEAENSIDYLVKECGKRDIKLHCIRINPMFAAKGTHWSVEALSEPLYLPPRLSDVMRLAEKKTAEGLKVYIGLSTEGLDEPGTSFYSREDYSSSLIRPIKLFNDRKIFSFRGEVPGWKY